MINISSKIRARVTAISVPFMLCSTALLSGCATPSIRHVATTNSAACIFPDNKGRHSVFDDECAKEKQISVLLNATESRPNDRFVAELIVAAALRDIEKSNPESAQRILTGLATSVPSFRYERALRNLAAQSGEGPCLSVVNPDRSLRVVCDLASISSQSGQQGTQIPAPR